MVETGDKGSFAVVFSVTDVTEDPVSLATSMEALVDHGAAYAPPLLTELLASSDFEIALTMIAATEHEPAGKSDGAWFVEDRVEFDSSKSATVFVNEPLDGDWTFIA